MTHLTHRPRRLRESDLMRDLVRETRLHVDDFIYPLFVAEGTGRVEAIQTLPGQNRYSVDTLVEEARRAVDLGIFTLADAERGIGAPGGTIATEADRRTPGGAVKTQPGCLWPLEAQHLLVDRAVAVAVIVDKD